MKPNLKTWNKRKIRLIAKVDGYYFSGGQIHSVENLTTTQISIKFALEHKF
jgi:hypothetical protein